MQLNNVENDLHTRLYEKIYTSVEKRPNVSDLLVESRLPGGK